MLRLAVTAMASVIGAIVAVAAMFGVLFLIVLIARSV